MYPPHPSTYGPGMQAYRAPSLFQPHRARQAIRDAHAKRIPPLIGYYAGLSSVAITRFLAPLGYDMVWIDWEHTSCGVERITSMVHDTMFMSEGRTMPFVRLPSHDHEALTFALDAGASIIVPQLETVEQAQKIISYTRFGAAIGGKRSAPPFRYFLGVTDIPLDPARGLHKCLNEQAAIMVQIETLAGVENLDEILTACGDDIDMVWLGSLDVRVSMGLLGNMGMPGEEPEWKAASQLFADTMSKHDKPWGSFAFGSPPFGSPDSLRQAGERLALVVVSADAIKLMAMGYDLQAARELFSDRQKNVEAVAAETAGPVVLRLAPRKENGKEEAGVNGSGSDAATKS